MPTKRPTEAELLRFPCCGHEHFGACATNCKTCMADAAEASRPSSRSESSSPTQPFGGPDPRFRPESSSPTQPFGSDPRDPPQQS